MKKKKNKEKLKIYINKKEDISDQLVEEEVVVVTVVEEEVVGKVAEEEVVQKVRVAEAMVGRVAVEMEVEKKAVLHLILLACHQILQAKAHQVLMPIDIQLPIILLFLFNTTPFSTLNMEYIFYYSMKRQELILKFSSIQIQINLNLMTKLLS